MMIIIIIMSSACCNAFEGTRYCFVLAFILLQLIYN